MEKISKPSADRDTQLLIITMDYYATIHVGQWSSLVHDCWHTS